MQKISLTVAALLSVNAVKFIDGQFDSKFDSFAQTTASSAAKAGSGVRAKWIELPNCQDFVLESEVLAFDLSVLGEYVPLSDDLSNAAIATCKGPATAKPPVPPAEPVTPPPENIPVA